MGIKEALKKFWNFLREDSWQSLIVSLIIAFVLIKFVFFPVLSFLTGSALPLVIVESCSMYHDDGLEKVLENEIYADYGLEFEDARGWDFQDGLSKGDVIFVASAKNAKVGDVVIFEGGARHPIIHRVIESNDARITTKGDHNRGILPTEKDIDKDKLIGKAVFKIPVVGWVKLIFFEWQRAPEERGLCG